MKQLRNRSLLFGEGLFETIRWKPSEEKLRLHYERLSNSAKSLGIPYPNYREFKEDLEKATRTDRELYVKYLLLSKGGDYLTDSPSSYRRLVVVRELQPAPDSVSLCFSTYRRHSSDPVCRHKTTSYLFNLMVKKEAMRKGYNDAIILNEKDMVCETATSNLLFLKGSKLYTPARESGLLWGTTLEFLSRKVEIKEEYIRLGSLQEYGALFVLNSLLLCVPVERLEGLSLKVDTESSEELRNILRACLYSPQAEGPQGK